MEESEALSVGVEPSESVTFGGLIDDQEHEKREDRKIAAALTQFFNSIDRTITMMRVYPNGHPLLDGLISQLLEQLLKAIEVEAEFVFNIDATELTTLLGTSVFSEKLAEKDQYIWYVAYADGMLQVRFSETLTADELNRFLRVVERSAAGRISSDDDTVTLLWEQQFEHISYYAVEGFVDAGALEDFGDRTEQDAIDLVVDAAIDPQSEDATELAGLFDNLSMTHLDLFTKMQVEANAKIIVPELRDQDLAYAFAVDPSLVDKMCAEWKAGADLEYRLIEALLSIIRTSPGSLGAERAGEMITSVTQQLLDSQMFDQAVRILDLLHSRRELFFEAEVDPLGELVEKLSDPMQIEALVNLFQRQIDKREALMRLFILLGPNTVLRQILNLLADGNRQVVALAQLVDLIFELVDDDERERLVTSPKFIESSTYLRRLMSELPERDFINWRPTARLIRKAIDDDEPDVRELALTLKHPCWDDDILADRYLVPMADDPDEGIRKLALELLGEKHPKLFQEAIRDTILARKLGDRTHAELRFLMRVYLDSAPDAPEYLRSLIDVKGWLGGDAVEFAKMAAAVLLEAGDPEALRIVDEVRGKFFTAPSVKKSYEQIVRRFASEELKQASEVSEVFETAASSGPPAEAIPVDPPVVDPGSVPKVEKAPPREAIELPDDLFDME